MKTTLVPLVGDLRENLYQLGLKERPSYLLLEERVSRLFSINSVLREVHEIWKRARTMIKKRKDAPGIYSEVLSAYAEGLGVGEVRYRDFISLFELAAHHGRAHPELMALLPGCTSVFQQLNGSITHTRLLDFPLVGIFESVPRLYYWQSEGRHTILSYSCEGLAPLFFQAVHGSGMSFALHHKPGVAHHPEGEDIFQIIFETLLDASDIQQFKREIKKRTSLTKWSLLLASQEGGVLAMDIDGPALQAESFNLKETSPLVFTNIPLQNDLPEGSNYLRFSQDRQGRLLERLKKAPKEHMLDIALDVEEQRGRNWKHPAATLSTVGAYHVDLTLGLVDVKEGERALVRSDKILRFSLADQKDVKVLKEATAPSVFEEAWKRASIAQGAFDQGQYDQAYHELQMALAIMPLDVWKQILGLYLCLWEFKFVTNSTELASVYKRLKGLSVPSCLKDQWWLLCSRFERRLGLVLTARAEELSPWARELMKKEQAASSPVFTAWMKLLYPRLEILDVITPYHR
jgi:hypothetical protein